MKVLVIGNLGYIGPVLGNYIKANLSDCELIGLDSGLYANDLTNIFSSGDRKYDLQYYKDVRDISKDLFKNIDVVISLAAVSNDPMGQAFKEATKSINSTSVANCARLAKKAGVTKFIFASSCSVYGFGGEKAKTELDDVSPLTDYAISKINAENKLMELATLNFNVTCLRFATACGVSDRTRLDLILNDFVWNYVNTGKVKVLSDGSPLRPLIDVEDMSRAITWAFTSLELKKFNVFNCGFNEANYSVNDIAKKVTNDNEGEIIINKNAPPDKRSYRVNFSKFQKASGFYTPIKKIETSISELKNHLSILKNSLSQEMEFKNNYRRHNTLDKLIKKHFLNRNLEWIK